MCDESLCGPGSVLHMSSSADSHKTSRLEASHKTSRPLPGAQVVSFSQEDFFSFTSLWTPANSLAMRSFYSFNFYLAQMPCREGEGHRGERPTHKLLVGHGAMQCHPRLILQDNGKLFTSCKVSRHKILWSALRFKVGA